jgi:hypothetical protein
MKLLLDGEQDGQGIEGVDSGVGQRSVEAQFVVGDVLFLPHNLDQLLLDLIARHRAAMIPRVRRHFWLLYPLWIVLCAGLFFALRNREDPSRRQDRIQSDDAAVRAVAILRQSDRARYAGYEAVHVAYAGRGEGGGQGRWVVLCDRVPHTALREAMVLELDARDGSLLVIRKPVR